MATLNARSGASLLRRATGLLHRLDELGLKLAAARMALTIDAIDDATRSFGAEKPKMH